MWKTKDAVQFHYSFSIKPTHRRKVEAVSALIKYSVFSLISAEAFAAGAEVDDYFWSSLYSEFTGVSYFYYILNMWKYICICYSSLTSDLEGVGLWAKGRNCEQTMTRISIRGNK